MKFTMTTLLAAALATVSFAQSVVNPLPVQFTLKATSIATGANVGSIVVDYGYHLRIDPDTTSPIVINSTSATTGGAEFPMPWTHIYGIQLMKRVPEWGSVVLSTDDSWDYDFPKDFLWVGDDLYYDDGNGLQTEWYACNDENPYTQVLAWHFENTYPDRCFLVSIQVVS